MTITTVTPDPRPESRYVADRDGWAAIGAAKGGACRSCGGRGEEFHHLVPRGQRGDDVAPNLVPLCRACHRSLTEHLPGWEEVAHRLREGLTPLELGYVKAKKGRAWLDRNLPAGDAGLCPRCRKKVAAENEPVFDKTPRPRKSISITVPVDERENGAEILQELFEMARIEAGRPEGTPVYFTLVDVLHFFLTTPKEAA